MRIQTLETIDQRIDRLKVLLRRLRAERRVAVLREKYRGMRLSEKSPDSNQQTRVQRQIAAHKQFDDVARWREVPEGE